MRGDPICFQCFFIFFLLFLFSVFFFPFLSIVIGWSAVGQACSWAGLMESCDRLMGPGQDWRILFLFFCGPWTWPNLAGPNWAAAHAWGPASDKPPPSTLKP